MRPGEGNPINSGLKVMPNTCKIAILKYFVFFVSSTAKVEEKVENLGVFFFQIGVC